jgi:hypothetical protein
VFDVHLGNAVFACRWMDLHRENCTTK